MVFIVSFGVKTLIMKYSYTFASIRKIKEKPKGCVLIASPIPYTIWFKDNKFYYVGEEMWEGMVTSRVFIYGAEFIFDFSSKYKFYISDNSVQLVLNDSETLTLHNNFIKTS